MERIRSYNNAVSYMFSQLPMYQRQGPKAFKKDLNNIIVLCDKIGNPHKKFKSVHIAGTNGKGTVTHLIACGLMAQGYKVGIYTSPHYRDFRERIKINGTFIPRKVVIRYLNEFLSTLQSLKPSFFELTVAMAFKYFADEEVDIAIIETGLGGRLDSTNIVIPELSVITNISYDHTAFLGETLELIAAEKAGIIKKGVPILIGEYQEEVAHVFKEMATALDSKLIFARVCVRKDGDNAIIFRKKVIENLQSDSGGPFFDNNLITAIAALDVLRSQGWKLDWQRFRKALVTFSRDLHFIGRWQWISKDPPILADSAHNPEGLTGILEAVSALNFKEIHFVLGFVNDKDLDKVLCLFPKSAPFYFAKADIPRGLKAKLLQEAAVKHGLRGKSYTSIRKALAAARTRCKEDELIFVGGSIFTVAEVI